MRLIPPRDEFAGSVVVEAVHACGGALLCQAGTTLTASLLRRLREHGVDAVAIEAEAYEGIDARECLDRDARWAMHQLFGRAAEQVAAGHAPTGLPLRPVQGVRAHVLEAVDRDPLPCLLWPRRALRLESGAEICAPAELDWQDTRDMVEALVVQALNTAIIVAAATRSLHLGPARREPLVDAALIHDLGMVTVPVRVWLRQGALGVEERVLMRNHPLASLEAFEGNERWDTFARLAVRQHHERLNGTGYPQGLGGQRVPISSLLLGAADVYAARIEPRPYRQGLPAEDLAAAVLAMGGAEFPPQVVRAVVESVGLYPRGGVLELSDGRRSVVVRPGRGLRERPVVRVAGEDLDLGHHPEIAVRGLVG